MEDAVRNLLRERQEKIAVLVSPQVKQLIAQYHPGQPDDDILKTSSGGSPTHEDPNDYMPEPWRSSVDAKNKKPQEGDKAYTRYQGETYVGKLVQVPGHTTMYLLPDKKTQYNGHGGIYVGYEEPIKWDAEKGMWHAPADPD